MRFTFGSWNLNNRHLRSEHVELLRSANCDLLAVQEAGEGFHAALTKADLFDWSVSSLTLRPPSDEEGAARRLGCSIFGRRPFGLESYQVLDGVRFPERTLVAHTRSEAGPVSVCSLHIPPGASWKTVKPQTMMAIAEWLRAQSGSIIVGMDANSPKTDQPNFLNNEWWWKDEPLLLGPSPLHQLRDAFRAFLKDRPALFDQIQAARPTGPLAISYFRGNGIQKIPCRYDVVLVSQNVTVATVEYTPLNLALSDHALVIGQLELEPRQFEPITSGLPAHTVTATQTFGRHEPGLVQANHQRSSRRPTLNFDEMGITTDSTLRSIGGSVKIRIAGPRTVRLDDAEMSLSEATRRALRRSHIANPCHHWTFNGKPLREIYNETYGPFWK